MLKAEQASESRAFCGLGQFLVLGQRHVSSQLDEDRLHGEITLPLHQTWQLGGIYLACTTVNTREVDFGDKGHVWRDVGIVVAAVDLEAVDSVLVCALHPISIHITASVKSQYT